MGKKLGLVVIAALMLTGCAAGGEEPQAVETVTMTATPEAAPIQAQAAPEETAAAGTFGNPENDNFFVKSAAPALVGEAPSDADLVGAAKLACEQMDAGTPWNTVAVISGIDPESDAHNNEVIGQYAAQIYCPAHNPF